MSEAGSAAALGATALSALALVAGGITAPAAAAGAGSAGAGSGGATAAHPVAVSAAHVHDCAPRESLAARTVRDLDGVVRGPEPSAATVASYERDLARRLDHVGAAVGASGGPGSYARLPKKPTTIRVFVHVIKPTKKAKSVKRKKIRRQIKVMNHAYAGKQWRDGKRSKFRFRIKRIDRTVNKRWYYAGLDSGASRSMRRTLHRGKKRDLNLYIAEPTERGSLQVLGYATFPQRPKRKLALDGVVIHRHSLPGGRFRGYNKGDTAVHETGHWLGLYHTFQGGCGKRGDRVDDTPKERVPSFKCPRGRDTCKAPGKDPIRNFMDYSFDRCMHHFTPGQIDRMRTLWRVYRR